MMTENMAVGEHVEAGQMDGLAKKESERKVYRFVIIRYVHLSVPACLLQFIPCRCHLYQH